MGTNIASLSTLSLTFTSGGQTRMYDKGDSMPSSNYVSSTKYLFLGLALMLTGCGGSENLIGPKNQLEVSNDTNTFQWQVSALSKVSQTLTYTWVNTGTTGNVNQASSLGGGSASLRVTDDGGVEVYSRSLGENGTFETDSGSPGNWTVTVSLTNAAGTLNFRIQKP